MKDKSYSYWAKKTTFGKLTKLFRKVNQENHDEGTATNKASHKPNKRDA